MRQLVGEELPASRRVRLVLSGAKHDVMPDRVSQSIDGPRRFAGAAIRMNPHVAEVVTKTALHIFTRVGIKRLSRRAQRSAHADRLRSKRTCHGRLALQPIPLTFFALAADARQTPAGALALQKNHRRRLSGAPGHCRPAGGMFVHFIARVWRSAQKTGRFISFYDL